LTLPDRGHVVAHHLADLDHRVSQRKLIQWHAPPEKTASCLKSSHPPLLPHGTGRRVCTVCVCVCVAMVAEPLVPTCTQRSEKMPRCDNGTRQAMASACAPWMERRGGRGHSLRVSVQPHKIIARPVSLAPSHMPSEWLQRGLIVNRGWGATNAPF